MGKKAKRAGVARRSRLQQRRRLSGLSYRGKPQARPAEPWIARVSMALRGCADSMLASHVPSEGEDFIELLNRKRL